MSLALFTGQLDKNESFADDVKGMASDFGLDTGVDIDSPISIKGADQAQELAGTHTEKSKKQYLDAVTAHKGRDVIIVAVTAPSKALIMGSGAHDHLLSLAHA